MLKVAVVRGGRSPERDVSMESGANAALALKQAGYDVVELDGDIDLASNLKKEKVEVVFIALHGQYGEDGTLQGMLEYLDIPYTGSGVLSSSLAINKIKSKEIFKANNISTPNWFTAINTQYEEKSADFLLAKLNESKFGYPVMIKPAMLGSTIGVTKPKNDSEFIKGIKEAFLYDFEILIEQFIDGLEVSVPVYGTDNPRALPVIEIIPKGDFYTYETKYQEGMSTHIIPARIDGSIYKAAQELAVKSYKALMCYGFARVDIMIDKSNNLYAIEVNTIPGMTKMSLFPESALKEGITFVEIVDTLVKWAVERHEKEKNKLLKIK